MPRSPRARPRTLCSMALLTLGLAASGCLDPIHLEPEGWKYRAVVRWTSHGVPHVLADDLNSAIYGQGYAFAQLNGCVLADQVLKVRSERAAFFGHGDDDVHLRSDLVLKSLQVYANAQAGIDDLGARTADGDAKAEELLGILEAYVNGYNDFITTRGDELPCGSEPWLRPVTTVDLLAHYVELGTLASGRQAHEFIWAAQPPASSSSSVAPDEPRATLDDFRDNLHMGGLGSNGWGIGRERSANGHGMLLANPHFPWEGELELYESHLRVPGQLDVYGASLMGVVGVLIGFNPDVAWTHTVSNGQRLTVYNLELDPTDPTRYMYDGESIPMDATTHEVQVLEEDGSMSTASRTFFSTPHHGPVVALPPLIWTPQQAFAIRDANANNQQMIAQFIGMNRATSMDQLQATHDQERGIPWVNTISTSRDGRAWYVDASATPKLSQEAIDAWLELRQTDFLTILVDDAGLVLLPGNSSTFAWQGDGTGARDPGLVPLAEVPRLERPDFVFNANDSHWLTNPLQPLVGYSPMHGFEQTPRSPRTRMNAIALLDDDRSTSGTDHQLDLDELRDAAFSNRAIMAELLRDAVVARCQGAAPVRRDELTVDVTEACALLASWDLRLDAGSVGAIVWREFLGDFDYDAMKDAGALLRAPFDPADPITTPHTLREPPDDPENDRMLQALAGAVLRLQQAGVPLSAPLGELQHTVRAGQRIPLHGGISIEGVGNIVDYAQSKTTLDETQPQGAILINPLTGLTERGYVVNFGSSFVMTMRFTDDDPEAYSLLTYGQSDDPRSPYHTDQTVLFSNKEWRRVLYTEDDIEQDPELEVEVLFGFPTE